MDTRPITSYVYSKYGEVVICCIHDVINLKMCNVNNNSIQKILRNLC